jgi:hypothetical protein
MSVNFAKLKSMEHTSIAQQDSATATPVLCASAVRQEGRSAVRFPLALPAVVLNEGKQYAGITKNISANGVLLEFDHETREGEIIKFSLRMSGQILGIEHDVLVHCTGRVVRCSLSGDQHLTAATIDEYRFAAQ